MLFGWAFAAMAGRGAELGETNTSVLGFERGDLYDDREHGLIRDTPDTVALPDRGEPAVWDDLVAAVHAPIHYQDTDDDRPTGDYLAPFDYDGNLVADDNWDHFWDFQDQLTGAVYYSVVETCTHWFVTYTMFHPQDWADANFEVEHENDAEGMLAVIRKDSAYGQLEALITQGHGRFQIYTAPDSGFVAGERAIDGTLTFEVYDGFLHPLTSQEAKGHGLAAWPHTGEFSGAPGEDGVIYFPGRTGELPASGTDSAVSYRLIDQFETLWPLELAAADTDYAGDTFAQWGLLRGDGSGDCADGWFEGLGENSAGMPWEWSGGIQQGGMALDPVFLVDHVFDGLGDFSEVYLRNRFAEDLRDAGWSNGTRPRGLGVDLDALYDRLDASCD